MESVQIKIESCNGVQCTAGRVLVEKTIVDLKQRLADNKVVFDDKQFLTRYAQSVTEFGETLNTENKNDGHGIWRINDNDAAIILKVNNIGLFFIQLF